MCVHAQSCQTVCDPMDYSPPGSSVHGILQARILEWVAISSSRGSSQPRDQTCISCIGRQILYHSTTGKPKHYKYILPKIPVLNWSPQSCEIGDKEEKIEQRKILVSQSVFSFKRDSKF